MDNNKSKHTIQIKNLFKKDFEGLPEFSKLQKIMDNYINSSINIPTYNTGNIILPNTPLKSLKTIYYQNTRLLNKATNKKPVYKKYQEENTILKHYNDVMIDDLKDILFSRNFISLDNDKFEALRTCLDNIIDDDDMLINIDVDNINKYDIDQEESEYHYVLSKKVFMKQHNDKLDYYFDEQIPSIIECKESTIILAHEEDLVDARSNKSYMALYHYTKLNVVVELIVNPDETKIVPAIVIYDANNKPVEVHCYYKNEYITPELMELIKPNILTEDFKEAGYFTKIDMDYLDMIAI